MAHTAYILHTQSSHGRSIGTWVTLLLATSHVCNHRLLHTHTRDDGVFSHILCCADFSCCVCGVAASILGAYSYCNV